MTISPALEFDADGTLVLKRKDGPRQKVRHPAGILHSGVLFDGDRALLGGYVDASAAEEFAYPFAWVDFVALGSPETAERWSIDADGICREPREVHLAAQIPGRTNYLLNPGLIALAQKYLNDFQIYTLLRLTAGQAAAIGYMDQFAAAHAPDVESDCRLVVLFNHHFARNCRTLHDFYRSRFPDIDFVVPCVAPRHPNYFAYPFGSYQYHGLVYGYLRERLRTATAKTRVYLFIQDDLMLHPRVSAATVAGLLAGEHGGMFPYELPYTLEVQNWYWTERVANALRRQADHHFGNGFEGLVPAVSPSCLHHGVSDCFAIRAELVPDFLDRLAPMVAANVFPEVAIPTALFAGVRAAGMSVALKPGLYLWGDERAKVRDPAFMAGFVASDMEFIHPMKIGSCDEAILRMFVERAGDEGLHA